ncbi:hypothetical protein CJI59_13995 [Streptomyces sp. Alain-F2R5]|nr:hypothetical protein CJI59_13995 [Streptomyces sp. Alain-F2R5]
MLALAIIFDTPIAYFFLPMEEGNAVIAMAQPEDRDGGGVYWAGIQLFLKRVLMDSITSESGSEFFVRAHAAVRNYMGLDWHAPVFMEPEMSRPGTVFPPGYRFGDPLDEEEMSDEDIAEAIEAEEQARQARAGEAERPLSRTHEAFLRRHAEELSLQIAEHLERMGYLRRDPPAQGESGAQSGQFGKYDEDPPF